MGFFGLRGVGSQAQRAWHVLHDARKGPAHVQAGSKEQNQVLAVGLLRMRD